MLIRTLKLCVIGGDKIQAGETADVPDHVALSLAATGAVEIINPDPEPIPDSKIKPGRGRRK